MADKYTVYRQGQFSCTPRGETHCGLVRDIKVSFQYECWVTTTDLDAKGFGIDNAKFQQAFDEISDLYDSCEELCLDRTRKLWRECRRSGLQAPSIVSIRVRVWGLPASGWAEYTWTNDEVEVG
jgi:hypothetical protein